MNFFYFNMEMTNISDFSARYWKILELVFTLTLYAIVFRGVVRRFKLRQRAKSSKYPTIPLAVHTTCAIIELLRYYILNLKSEPVPDLFDCVVGMIFAVTSIQMQNTISNGNTVLVRSCYQATALQMFVGAAGSYVYGSARLHRGVIKNYNQFFYIRPIMKPIHNLRLAPNFQDAYALAVLSVNYLALWEGAFPAGIPTHFILTGAFAWLNHWVSKEIAKKFVTIIHLAED